MNSSSPPLHQRYKILGKVRAWFRATFFRQFHRLMSTDDARDEVRAAVLPKPRRPLEIALEADDPVTDYYPEIGTSRTRAAAAASQNPIFVTARFRSGSTLIWNLFRAVEGFTAYYEPFNERRWFDRERRGKRVDPSHLKVTDYWREYESLAELDGLYDSEWHTRDLFLARGTWLPDMKRYIEILIEKAPARPVLQFNRVDFRVPWLRDEFPNATILHVFRHPRDQWLSTLMGSQEVTKDVRMDVFRENDHFYLGLWAQDLKRHFPFLEDSRIEHPYQLFYYLWRLSHLFGRKYAHLSFSYESLLEEPRNVVAGIFTKIGAQDKDLDAAVSLIRPRTLGKWKEYAEESWFKRHEEHCEAVLADFLLPSQKSVTNSAASEPFHQ